MLVQAECLGELCSAKKVAFQLVLCFQVGYGPSAWSRSMAIALDVVPEHADRARTAGIVQLEILVAARYRSPVESGAPLPDIYGGDAC